MTGARALALAAALWITPSAALAEISPTLRALLLEYHCQLVSRLERTYDFGSLARDRFLTATAAEHQHGYVKCTFIFLGERMRCEAASGFYYEQTGGARTFRLAPAKVAALARLGFSTDDSRGDFRIEFDVADEPDFSAIAALILTALHDGYDARAQSTLQFNAPFARRPNLGCIPSG
jgi:hypothetical protein